MEREMFADEEPPEEREMDDMEEALPEMAEAGGWPTEAGGWLAEAEEADNEMWAAARRWAGRPAGWRVVTLVLSADEHVALNKLAMDEERRKNEMAEVIVRRELRRRGLLPPPQPTF